MANSILHSQLPPIYGAAWNLWVAFRKADGTSLAPTSLDTEVSKDGGTFADATNEITLIKEVGGSVDSAFGYLTLTADEMSCDALMVQIKSANCVTVEVTLTPLRLLSVRAGCIASFSGALIYLETAASPVDKFYNGMVIRLEGQTAAAGQARIVGGYTGASRQLCPWPAFTTDPDDETLYTIGLLPTMSVNSWQLDALLSSRGTADPGDAMDLVADAVDAAALKADAAAEVAAAVLAAIVEFPGATDKSVGECLQAAWGLGAGSWTRVGTVFTIWAPDGLTALFAFDLDKATSPTSRTPAYGPSPPAPLPALRLRSGSSTGEGSGSPTGLSGLQRRREES